VLDGRGGLYRRARLISSFNGAAAGNAGGALDAAEQMAAERRLGIALRRVAHRSIPAPTAVYRLAPGDRIVGAHFAAGVGPFAVIGQPAPGSRTDLKRSWPTCGCSQAAAAGLRPSNTSRIPAMIRWRSGKTWFSRIGL